MQPIRPLSFAEILDELRDTKQPAAPNTARINPDWLFHLVVEEAGDTPDLSREGASAYRETSPEALVPICELSEEERVAMELELHTAQNLKDLTRIRRLFARRNHPDLVHRGGREEANARMKIANMLIDRRSKELAARG